ncbi:MAG: protein kinase [Myxococcales bacterium]|nr:protein kinase [Myxococcales bacterium]
MDALGRSTRKPGAMVCGKWRIVQHLRSTPTTATYAALHRNGAEVTLKILHSNLAGDKTLQARFRREAYVANTVPHPDAVKVIDDDETEDGCALLVMDHFEGDTLEELRIRKRGKLPYEQVAGYMEQLLDILAAAHDAGVVHRDLKPEAVLVTKQGRVKVHDFGTARVLTETANVHEMTAAGLVVGSPANMAPEQARGQRDLVDAQSDIFSLGALYFLLLSGRAVHEEESPLAALMAAASRPAPSLRTVVGVDVPDGVVEAVDRALAFMKVNRWPDARAFKAALRAGRGEMIDTFPQAGRRDPLADLMGSMKDGAALAVAFATGTQDDPGFAPDPSPPQAPQAARAPGAPLPPQAPQAARAPGAPLPPQAPQAARAPGAPLPPQAPQAARAPGAPLPPQAPQAARAPGAPLPPQAPQAARAPGAPLPPQAPQAARAPGAPLPPQVPQAARAPGAPLPPQAPQAARAPGAPLPPQAPQAARPPPSRVSGPQAARPPGAPLPPQPSQTAGPPPLQDRDSVRPRAAPTPSERPPRAAVATHGTNRPPPLRAVPSTPPRAPEDRPSFAPDSGPGGGGYLAPVGVQPWQQSVEEEDAPTIAGPMDPELSAALAQVLGEAAAIRGAVAPPRVGPTERPSVAPRPAPSAPAVAPQTPAARPAVVARQPSRQASGPGSERQPLASAPSAPAAPAASGDPRYSTVVIPGSPGQAVPDARMKPAVFDADMMSDDRTQVDMPLPPPRALAVIGPPQLPPPTSQASPRGFAFIPAPELPPEMRGYDPGPARRNMPSHPFEVFEAAPPPPVMPQAPTVPQGAFPGRRLSTHEDLRILVPEKSYAMDHNPFAAALRRRQRIKVGILVFAAMLGLGLAGAVASRFLH